MSLDILQGFLQPFMFTEFLHPWLLVLLIFVPILFLLECTAGSPGAMTISTGADLSAMRSDRHRLLRRLPAVARALALTLLIVALARPLTGLTPVRDDESIIDLMLCIDVSGSMRATDFSHGRDQRNRLDVVKDVAVQFVEERKQRASDRFGSDRIGLILYAGMAWTQVPLTLDYEILKRGVEAAHIDESDPRKQGTAIGTAIGLAVSRLRHSEASSKVIILMTDGINNRGELDPITAANMAKEYGIRVYTIGAGAESNVVIPGFGAQRAFMPIDERSLRAIADITGAAFYHATDEAGLQKAYAEISELERTDVPIVEYYDYDEGFAPFATLGALLMAASIFSRRIWFDPIP